MKKQLKYKIRRILFWYMPTAIIFELLIVIFFIKAGIYVI